MKVLITAGPTREKLDVVRFISNRSTGKMGYALAAAARDAGHEVVLVSGPVALCDPAGVKVVRIESAAEMSGEVKKYAPEADLIIMAAAVADYRPAHPIDEKLKKTPGSLFLELERTEDILASLGAEKRPDQILVGFAAESSNLEERAKGKLFRKNLDWIAGNLVSNGFGKDTNTVILYNRNGEEFALETAPKNEIAAKMLEIILH